MKKYNYKKLVGKFSSLIGKNVVIQYVYINGGDQGLINQSGELKYVYEVNNELKLVVGNSFATQKSFSGSEFSLLLNNTDLKYQGGVALFVCDGEIVYENPYLLNCKALFMKTAPIVFDSESVELLTCANAEI